MPHSNFLERFTIPEFNAFLNVWHTAGDSGDDLIQTMAFAAMANHARSILAIQHPDWSDLSSLARDVFVTEYIGSAIRTSGPIVAVTPVAPRTIGERMIARLESAIAHLDAR